MRARIEQRLRKLVPLLDIDDDGMPLAGMELHEGRRWSSEHEDPSVRLAEFPAEFDD